jgi:RNA polymerase sigma-70 factor (ECF subfamily)
MIKDLSPGAAGRPLALRPMEWSADLMGPASQNPEELINRARAGQTDALGELLELYRSYLTLLARVEIDRRIQGKLSASDVVQDAFLQAHHLFGQFRGTSEQELIAWLRRILANRLVDIGRRFLRAQRRDVRLEQSLRRDLELSSQALEERFAASQTSPSAAAIEREQAVLLADVLQSLPADYREVIVLRQLEGLSLQQVADRMGRTVDSVRKLWTRGLIQLRRRLGEAP